jgi:hypothetical protein
VAQLVYALKKYNPTKDIRYLLATLSVREVSEADQKYSAVVSVPFPLSVLNLVFGSIVLAAKSKQFNYIMLHAYFFPVFITTFMFFSIY